MKTRFNTHPSLNQAHRKQRLAACRVVSVDRTAVVVVISKPGGAKDARRCGGVHGRSTDCNLPKFLLSFDIGIAAPLCALQHCWSRLLRRTSGRRATEVRRAHDRRLRAAHAQRRAEDDDGEEGGSSSALFFDGGLGCLGTA